jgi:hypothetical protein
MAAVGDYVTELRVMSGDGMTVLYAQDVTGEMVADTWNTFDLDEAVAFDNTENLWIGIYVERPGGTFNEPTAGAIVSGQNKCDFFAYNGGAWTTIFDQYGIGAQAWMLRGFITTSAGKEVALGQGDYTTTEHNDYSTSPSVPTGNGMIASTMPNTKFPQEAGNSNREFMGYNIYKNGDLLVSMWPDDFYDDSEFQLGYYCYTVTAEYSVCGESDPSNEACVEVTVGLNELGANKVSIYPNPAKDYVNIVCEGMKDITVFNYVGQVIYRSELGKDNSTQLNTSNFESGVYVVRINTENGVVTKRVIINK